MSKHTSPMLLAIMYHCDLARRAGRRRVYAQLKRHMREMSSMLAIPVAHDCIVQRQLILARRSSYQTGADGEAAEDEH